MPNPRGGGAFDPAGDYTLSGNVQLTGPGSAITNYGVFNSATATVSLTAAQSGGMFLFDRASGVTYTLPPPVIGLNFEFCVTTSVSSNNHKIITASGNGGTQVFIGSIWEAVAAGTGTQFFPNGSTHVAVTMNGTTTGGLVNTYLTVIAVSSTQWLIDGTVEGSGTIATPFATS